MRSSDAYLEPNSRGIEQNEREVEPGVITTEPGEERNGADSDDGSSASWVILDEDTPDDSAVSSALTDLSNSDPISTDSADFVLHSSDSTVLDSRVSEMEEPDTPASATAEAVWTPRRRQGPAGHVTRNDNDSENDQLSGTGEDRDSCSGRYQEAGLEERSELASSDVGCKGSCIEKDRWDDTDLSTLPDQTLPDAWTTANHRLRHYVHQRNAALNHLLTVVMVLCLTCALGLGAGHFLGWLHHTELTEGMVQNLDEKLVHLRDDLMTCMTTEEDQDLDNKWIKELLHENEALIHQLQGDDAAVAADAGNLGCSESVAELRSQLHALRAENEQLRATVARLHAKPAPAAGAATTQTEDEQMIEQRNQINELRTENSELARELRRHRYLSPSAGVPRQVEADSASRPAHFSDAMAKPAERASMYKSPERATVNASEDASLAAFYAHRSSERQRARLSVPPVPINWMMKRAELRALRRGAPKQVSWLLQRQRARQQMRQRRAEQAEVRSDDQRWRQERNDPETGRPREDRAEPTHRSDGSQQNSDGWMDFTGDRTSKHSHDSPRKRTYEYTGKHNHEDDDRDDDDDDGKDEDDDSYVKKVKRYIRKAASYQRKIWRAANRKAEKMYKKINENYWKHLGDKRGYYKHQHAYQF